MQAESLEVLEKASVAPAQAHAIVRAIEIELIRGEMSALRAEIAREGGELRAEIYGATRQMYMALLIHATVMLASFCFAALLLR